MSPRLVLEHRFKLLVFAYSLWFVLGLLASYALRWDFNVPAMVWDECRILIFWLVPFKLVVLSLFGQLDVLPTYFGFTDVKRIVFSMTVVVFVLLILWLLSGGMSVFAPPRSIIALDFLISVSGLFSIRYGLNRLIEGGSGFVDHSEVEAIGVIGAGSAGASFVNSVLKERPSRYRPLFFLDDDISKRGVLIHNVPVVGAPEQILELKKKYDFNKVIVAMPSAPQERIRQVIRLSTEAECRVEILPSLQMILSGRSQITAVRTPRIEDVLGRAEIHLDKDSIVRLYKNESVLVTGAGGSIGQELSDQLSQCEPSDLILLDRSEFALYQVEAKIRESGFRGRLWPKLVDLQNKKQVDRLFSEFKIQHVFHAAAHKHVPIMERDPGEAIRNNALVSAYLIDSARRHGATSFLLISSDKAVNPTSIMGATKRLAEMYLQSRSVGEFPTRLTAVRFGNVLGSSGSVVPLFRSQIEAGGPVTVTHSDMERFFMTISEAVGLVLQCSAQAEDRGVLVLDMGTPVRVLELAHQMIRLSGYRPDVDIPIKIVGIRPGEKLKEEIIADNENHAPTPHPQIFRFQGTSFDQASIDLLFDQLEKKSEEFSPDEWRDMLKEKIPEYNPVTISTE